MGEADDTRKHPAAQRTGKGAAHGGPFGWQCGPQTAAADLHLVRRRLVMLVHLSLLGAVGKVGPMVLVKAFGVFQRLLPGVEHKAFVHGVLLQG